MSIAEKCGSTGLRPGAWLVSSVRVRGAVSTVYIAVKLLVHFQDLIRQVFAFRFGFISKLASFCAQLLEESGHCLIIIS